MRLAGLASLVVAIVACSNEPPPQAPLGPEWYRLKCDKGSARCLERAEKACPSGYELADRRIAGNIWNDYRTKDVVMVRCTDRVHAKPATPTVVQEPAFASEPTKTLENPTRADAGPEPRLGY